MTFRKAYALMLKGFTAEIYGCKCIVEKDRLGIPHMYVLDREGKAKTKIYDISISLALSSYWTISGAD